MPGKKGQARPTEAQVPIDVLRAAALANASPPSVFCCAFWSILAANTEGRVDWSCHASAVRPRWPHFWSWQDPQVLSGWDSYRAVRLCGGAVAGPKSRFAR